MRSKFLLVWLPLLTLAFGGCDDTENPDETNENEVITTVVLRFTPTGGGDVLEFRWADPENDGSPVIDDIVLSDAQDYTLSVSFLNELESPAEDITQEVSAESEEHQIFITGTAVSGPATGASEGAVVSHSYGDVDENGFPIGLENSILTLGVGSGTFMVTLRHLPPEGDAAVKTADLAVDVASGGFDVIPGDTDVQVSFELAVE